MTVTDYWQGQILSYLLTALCVLVLIYVVKRAKL